VCLFLPFFSISISSLLYLIKLDFLTETMKIPGSAHLVSASVVSHGSILCTMSLYIVLYVYNFTKLTQAKVIIIDKLLIFIHCCR
jgi:hypothetical protein